ncbi:nucleotide disphospho-sugar-binding domain-containing protein [Cryptosporangium sp. NPDC051539]|uniref:nucleotide disphospho-sugar-binding domain-containing protein n=1 Tax=Cryptosporangium sp. NPDC051539 TaxID=3363962 RepID=UPI00378F5E55
MRVLVVAAPVPGHVLPLLPLSRALAAAGTDVLIATAGDAVATGERAGLPVEDLAPGFDLPSVSRGVTLRHPLAGTTGSRGTGALFGAINARLVDALLDATERFRPDVLVAEPLAVAGQIAAAVHGVPLVRHEINLADGAELSAAAAGPSLRRLRIDRLPEPVAVIQVAPTMVVGERPGWPMRYEPPTVAPLPSWLTETPALPRILVSRSTAAGSGSAGLMKSLVPIASRVDAEIVLVRPEPGLPPRLPDNVRTIGWVSLDAVLPTCSGIVHHGGSGTVQAAFAAGVPQLVHAPSADHRYNAEAVARAGAGICVPGRNLAVDDVTRLIGDDTLRKASVTIQDELAARPSPAEIAGRVLALATASAPG